MNLQNLLQSFKSGLITADKKVKEEFIWKNRRTGEVVNLGYGVCLQIKVK